MGAKDSKRFDESVGEALLSHADALNDVERSALVAILRETNPSNPIPAGDINQFAENVMKVINEQEARDGTPGERTQASASGARERFQKRIAAIFATLLVTTTIFGLGYLFGLGRGTTGQQVLVARLQVVNEIVRGTDEEPVIIVDSPRTGFASVVISDGDRLAVLPSALGDEIRILRSDPARIPIGTNANGDVLVFVTESAGAHEVIRKFLFENRVQSEELVEAVTTYLHEHGYVWIARGSVEVLQDTED